MDWLKRILDKSENLSAHAGQSAQWGTCAIGEARHASLSTVVVGLGAYTEPEDRRLLKLGYDFHRAVQRNRRTEALRVYFAIQRRLATLAKVKA